MDSIDRAIANGYGKHNDGVLSSSLWEDFEREALNCCVILFGVGAGIEFYLAKYGEKAKIDYIVDNDASLHGIKIRQFLMEDLNESLGSIGVCGTNIFSYLPRDKTIVLITSLRHDCEIAECCRSFGMDKIYSLICMERVYRQYHTAYRMPDRRKLFLAACQKKPLERKVLLMTTCDCAGHGKEIARQLKRMDSSVDIVWHVGNVQMKAPDGVRLIHRRAYRDYVYERSTASVWLTDTGIGRSIEKRDGQICIQMKHWSSITLKMFGYDELNYRGESEKAMKEVFGLDFDGTHDYILVGSKFDEDSCRSGFRFSGEVFYAGSPRSDVLFAPNKAKRDVLEKYPMLKGKNTLLFAPTYRIREKGSADVRYQNDLEFEKVYESLKKRFGGEWAILLRLHPFVANLSKDIKRPDYVIDVSDYYDSEELVAISDVLITDYSSIMFEPAHVRKPVFLLATDMEWYLKEERGFLIDYETLPFPHATSTEELINNIETFDQEKYIHEVDSFLNQYGVHEDGHAAERAARFILGLLDKKRT